MMVSTIERKWAIILSMLVGSCAIYAGNQEKCDWINRAVATFGCTPEIKKSLDQLPAMFKQPDVVASNASYWQKFASTDLGCAYPAMVGKISYEQCCNPTAIVNYADLADHFGVKHYMVKLDNQTGIKGADTDSKLFGGNKPRKLGFLLADLKTRGYERVMTIGALGSNHAVATAEYARHLGIACFLLLTPQPNTLVVERNQGRMRAAGAHIIACADIADRMTKAWDLLMTQARQEKPAYVIPTGGSTELGALGHVNALYCLDNHLRSPHNVHGLPIPDQLYVAAGSFGTLAGLLVGARSLKWPTKITGVLIEPPLQEISDVTARIVRLTQATQDLLGACDASFPKYTWSEKDITIDATATGMGYGILTLAGNKAHNLIAHTAGEDYTLDDCYTAKVCAAMHETLESMHTDRKNNLSILYWHTFDNTGLNR